MHDGSMNALILRRIVLTAVAFTVVWPLAGGAIMAALYLALGVFWPDNTGLAPVGLLLSALVYPPPAMATGLLLAVFSHRIPTRRAWLGNAALSGAALTLASLLVVFRSIYTEGPLEVGLYVVAGLTLCSLPCALAAAAMTLRLRPPPPLMPMAGDVEARA